VRVHTVIGVVAGLVSWWILFLLSLTLFAIAWPDFGEAGERAQRSGDFSQLTPAMLALLLGSYVYINGIAGWVTQRIAGHRAAVWIASSAIFAYATFQHLHLLWSKLPAWYNLGVVALIFPLSILGGALAAARVRA
jgi:hypothetical protein